MDFFLDDVPEEQLIKLEKSVKDNNKSSGVSNGKIEKLFLTIESNLSKELVQKTGAIFQFNVKGNFQCKIFSFIKQPRNRF